MVTGEYVEIPVFRVGSSPINNEINIVKQSTGLMYIKLYPVFFKKAHKGRNKIVSPSRKI